MERGLKQPHASAGPDRAARRPKLGAGEMIDGLIHKIKIYKNKLIQSLYPYPPRADTPYRALKTAFLIIYHGQTNIYEHLINNKFQQTQQALSTQTIQPMDLKKKEPLLGTDWIERFEKIMFFRLPSTILPLNIISKVRWNLSERTRNNHGGLSLLFSLGKKLA